MLKSLCKAKVSLTGGLGRMLQSSLTPGARVESRVHGWLHCEQRLGGLNPPPPGGVCFAPLPPLIQALLPGFTAEPHMLSRHLGKVFQLKVVTQ